MLRWLAGVKGRRIRELTSVVQKRFKFPEGTVELYAEKVNNRGLCAIAQAESLRYKLLGGLAVRRWGPLPSALATLATHPFYTFSGLQGLLVCTAKALHLAATHVHKLSPHCNRATLFSDILWFPRT